MIEFTNEELEKLSELVDEAVDSLGKWEGDGDSDEYKFLVSIQDKIDGELENV